MIYIGIDPGLHGAVVGLSEKSELLFWFDCPHYQREIRTKRRKPKDGESKTKVTKRNEFAPPLMAQNLLHEINDAAYGDLLGVMIEHAQARPGQNASGTFKAGFGAGLWQGVVSGLGFPFGTVTPQKWQKAILKDVVGGDTKAKAFAYALKWPTLPLCGPRGAMVFDGRADAACLAEYARKLDMGEL